MVSFLFTSRGSNRENSLPSLCDRQKKDATVPDVQPLGISQAPTLLYPEIWDFQAHLAYWHGNSCSDPSWLEKKDTYMLMKATKFASLTICKTMRKRKTHSWNNCHVRSWRTLKICRSTSNFCTGEWVKIGCAKIWSYSIRPSGHLVMWQCSEQSR